MNNLLKVFGFMIFILGLNSCIGDDIIEDKIDPVVRILNPVDTIEINTSYQFEATYFNNVGQEEMNTLTWTSSDESIISITSDGNATAHELGNALIMIETTSADGEVVTDEYAVVVGNSTVVVSMIRTGTVQTTTFYDLEGDFSMEEIDGKLILSFADNYKASANLPGLYVYLSNNPNTLAGAFEIGAVTVFDGAHSYELDSSVGLTDFEYVLYFCKPFNVKVGDGQFDN